MNNDIYYLICKLDIFNYNDYTNLMLVNKTFYKIITNLLRFKACKTIKKYLRNMRSNLLYKRMSVENLIELFKNKKFYIEFDELINKNINTISVPSSLIEHDITNVSNNIFETRIGRYYGDIMQSFTIQGKNIKKVEIYINTILVWKSYYLNDNLINIQPFYNGLFLLGLVYSTIYIKIYADECSNVMIYYKHLDHKVRIILAHKSIIKIPYVFYNNNRLYKNIIYDDGMLYLN